MPFTFSFLFHQASRHYLTVARSMKQYEDELYAQWIAKIEETLPLLLKKSILSKPPVPTPLPASTVQTPMPEDSRSTSRAADYSHILPPGELLYVCIHLFCANFHVCMCDFSAVPPNCEFVVNFSSELSEIISESRYMEKLGYVVPPLACNVALQEEKFLGYCAGLEHCLNRYHTLLASLHEAEVLIIHSDWFACVFKIL